MDRMCIMVIYLRAPGELDVVPDCNARSTHNIRPADIASVPDAHCRILFIKTDRRFHHCLRSDNYLAVILHIDLPKADPGKHSNSDTIPKPAFCHMLHQTEIYV